MEHFFIRVEKTEIFTKIQCLLNIMNKFRILSEKKQTPTLNFNELCSNENDKFIENIFGK